MWIPRSNVSDQVRFSACSCRSIEWSLGQLRESEGSDNGSEGCQPNGQLLVYEIEAFSCEFPSIVKLL
jgi:hypothetical protein